MVALWHKLLNLDIDGKLLNLDSDGNSIRIVHNMYQKAKSCVRVGNSLSECFKSYTGVRQGENESPVLFSLFLNDLTQFMSSKYGLVSVAKATHESLGDGDVLVFLKLYLLLYADDTVILAENERELQATLDDMAEYCNIWDLHVTQPKPKL